MDEWERAHQRRRRARFRLEAGSVLHMLSAERAATPQAARLDGMPQVRPHVAKLSAATNTKQRDRRATRLSEDRRPRELRRERASHSRPPGEPARSLRATSGRAVAPGIRSLRTSTKYAGAVSSDDPSARAKQDSARGRSTRPDLVHCRHQVSRADGSCLQRQGRRRVPAFGEEHNSRV
jgi:hypothetical protein